MLLEGGSLLNSKKEDLDNALQVITSTIANCKKIQPKFKKGSPQYSLLKNRINALSIGKSLITEKDSQTGCSREDLARALPPVDSILNKCKKAQHKQAENTFQWNRLENMIRAMDTLKKLMTDKIDS